MHTEFINLLVFVALTAAFRYANEKLQPKIGAKVGSGHLALLAGAAAHPVTWESIQHYLVHLVVYSGYVIPKH